MLSIYEMLASIGVNEKEAKVYMYLVEYGLSGASEIARAIKLPKSSINFLADSLWRRGLLTKTMRTNTGYYEADITLIEKQVQQDILKKQTFLEEGVTLLKAKNARVKTHPKISFLEGVENCKRAYLDVLKQTKHFYEFGAHADLAAAFGEPFMDQFIAERVERGVFCEAISTADDVSKMLHTQDVEQLRSLRLFDGDQYGKIRSSIVIYENSVLILNLSDADIGILIQNHDFSETLRTVFEMCRR